MIFFEFLGPPELLIRMLRAFSATDLQQQENTSKKKNSIYLLLGISLQGSLSIKEG